MYDIKKLPFGNEYDPPERIVCAANAYYDNINVEPIVIAGVRHACNVMRDAHDAYVSCGAEMNYNNEVQGFLTSKYRFVDRHEAWKIAVEQQQIVRRVGGDTLNGGCLFSENLY